MSNLPPELVRQIVDHLRDDERSLQQASRVSTIFRHPCQEALFSELLLHHPSHTACQNLVEAFQESPNILSYIKAVIIIDDTQHYTPEEVEIEALPSLNEKLSHVLSFIQTERIREYVCSISYPTWSKASATLRAELTRLCSSPCLQSLHLNRAPLHIVRRTTSPHLKNLVLEDMWQWEGNDGSLAEDSSPDRASQDTQPTPQLEMLSIDESVETSSAIVKNDTSIFNLRSLKTLRFIPARDEAFPLADISDFLSLCAASLETLHFSTQLIQGTDLSPLINLKTLGVVWVTIFFDHFGRRFNPFNLLPTLLDTIPSNNVVETIQLSSAYDKISDVRGDSAFWLEIDRRLATRQQFPKLRHVEIQVDTYRTLTTTSEHVQQIYNAVDELFPLLRQAGAYKRRRWSDL